MALLPRQLLKCYNRGPNCRHRYCVAEVEINGAKYSGEASNKKEAKLNCTLKALKEVYDIEYPEHTPDEDEDDGEEEERSGFYYGGPGGKFNRVPPY